MRDTKRNKCGLAAVAVAAALLIGNSSSASADAGFQNWVKNFYGVAAKSGITRQTYNSVFAGITAPDPKVLERANYQPEFTSETWDYIDARVTKFTVERGRELRKKYDRWLDLIESRYGVDRDVLLAIWSIETIYGDYLDRPEAVHHIGQALATLAYADRRRAKYARQQLIAALKIVQNGDIGAKDLVGSWAGAMGHTQFIPTSYQAWAVDIDGNGRRDVWNSVPDALASSANLLKRNGWVSGQTWGYEVRLPSGFNMKLANDDGYTIRDFERMGVTRPNGLPFGNQGQSAVLKLFEGPNGPAFLMMRNFYVLKRYNNSDKYALTVGYLADRIAGGEPFYQKWPRPYQPLDEDERVELQKRLQSLGFYDGKIDGNIGSGSKAAIVSFQRRAGMETDGFPSQKVLARLRLGL